MAEERVDVRNAADRKQVQDARRRNKIRRDLELSDIRTLLSLPEGRRVLWRFIHHFRPNANIFETGALLPYRAGFHDAGIFIMSEIQQAKPEAMFLLWKEDAERRERDALIQAGQSQQQPATTDNEEV
jgi:hypothetical protein